MVNEVLLFHLREALNIVTRVLYSCYSLWVNLVPAAEEQYSMQHRLSLAHSLTEVGRHKDMLMHLETTSGFSKTKSEIKHQDRGKHLFNVYP